MAQMLLAGCLQITLQAIWAKYVRYNQWWTYQDGVRSCAISRWSKYDLMLCRLLKQATDFLYSEQGKIGGNDQQRLCQGTRWGCRYSLYSQGGGMYGRVV